MIYVRELDAGERPILKPIVTERMRENYGLDKKNREPEERGRLIT